MHVMSMLCVTTVQALLPVAVHASTTITSNSTRGRGTSPVKPWSANGWFSAADVSQLAPLSDRADFSHSCGQRSTAAGRGAEIEQPDGWAQAGSGVPNYLSR